MDTDTHYKNRIGQRLTEILLNSYEDGSLTSGQVAFLAGVISEELSQATSSSKVFSFLEELAAEYPVFAKVLSEPTEKHEKNINRHLLEQLAK